MVFDLGHQGTVEVAEEEAGQGGKGTGQGGRRKFWRRRRGRRSNNRSMWQGILEIVYRFYKWFLGQ